MTGGGAWRALGAGILGAVLAAGSCEGNVNDGGVTLAVTVLASVSNAGGQGDDNSRWASVSSDGRYVAFESDSTNLAPFTTTAGRTHVYVRDMISRSTVLVSVDVLGGEPNGSSITPSISGDGRYVAFSSFASGLVAVPDLNGVADVFIRDLLLGTTTLVSVNSGGANPANGASTEPVVSADGRFVAFTSTATDLIAGFSDGNAGGTDVFRRDLTSATTVLLSVSTSSPTSANNSSSNCSISADGNRIVYQSLATNLPGDVLPAEANLDVFLRDLTPPGPPATLLLSRASGLFSNKGDGGSHDAMISADGRVVAFHSHATNLDPRDTTPLPDIFVRDLSVSPPVTEVITLNTSGAQAGQDCDLPAISSDGRYVVYQSGSASLVDGDTNNSQDVFLRDRVARTTVRVSVATFGGQASGAPPFLRPGISADGRYVGFESTSADLVERDVNGRTDVILRGPLF